MIEFNAACGHGLRADDDQAGQLMRCAYCGREVRVPRAGGDLMVEVKSADLDAMAQVEQSAQAPHRPAASTASTTRVPEPRVGSVAWLIMALGAGVLIVFVGIATWFSQPHDSDRPAIPSPIIQDHPVSDSATDIALSTADDRIDGTVVSEPAVTRPPRPGADEATPPLPVVAPRRGLLIAHLPTDAVGVFIDTADVDADVHLIPTPDLYDGWLDSGRYRMGHPGVHALQPGSYRVALVVDAAALSAWPELVDALDGEDLVLLAKLQDIDAAVLAEIRDGRLVRHYDIEVQDRRWSLVTAWFGPSDEPLPNRRGPRYGLERADVVGELIFYEVDESEIPDLVSMLAHAGQVVHVLPDGSRRMFEVDLADGRVRSTAVDPTILVARPQQAAPASRLAAVEPPPLADPVVAVPDAGHPWGRPRGVTADRPPEYRALEDVTAGLRRMRNDDHLELLRSCCPDGTHHGLWLSASALARLDVVAAAHAAAILELCLPLGRLMLAETDLGVRLALLERLAATGSACAVHPIDQRTTALEDQPATPATRRELAALAAARRRLVMPQRGDGRNPWDR